MVLVAVKSSKKRLISQFISRIKHEPVYGGLNLQFCRYVGVQEKCLMTSLLRHSFIRNGEKLLGQSLDIRGRRLMLSHPYIPVLGTCQVNMKL